MGADNCIKIEVVTPFTQLPEAPVTVTGVEPVTVKSLPLGEMELQLMGLRKISSSLSGAQVTGFILSIGVGCTGSTITAKLSPTGTRLLQLSSRVLPSVPFFMLTV